MTERQSLIGVGVAHLVLFAALSLALRSITPPLPAEDAAVDVVTLADAPKMPRQPKQPKQPKPVVAEADPPPPMPKAEPTPAKEPAPVTKPPKPDPKVEPVEKKDSTEPVKTKAEKPKPAPTKPAPTKPAPQLLDAKALSTLLDKAVPKTKAKPLDTSALAKSIETALPKATRVDPRAAAALVGAIRSQVAPCWNPPISSNDAKKMTVLLHLDINRDGSIVGRPGIVSQTGVTSGNADYARTFAETARRAVLRCSPLKLPPDLYDQWKAVEINFDPSDLS